MARASLAGAAIAGAVALASPAGADPGARSISASAARVGDAVAEVSGSTALLSDGQISQRWAIVPDGPVTQARLADPVTGRNWAAAGAPEFEMLLDSARTSSASGWKLLSATARRMPYSRARPDAGPGVAIVFRYGLGTSGGPLELDRTWSLYPGAGVEAVAEQIVNRTPLSFRVGKYSLAQLTARKQAAATILAYHGGSDWRQDFRSTAVATGSFDREGEVARFEGGAGSGWFFVGERRGGPMSRAGRDPAGRTWIGVDNARDAFDWGPIRSSPPNYNRQENPVYPAPVRQRTLTPFATLDLGRAYVGVYHGGASEAAATFVRDFAGHVMPRGRETIDLNTFHPWAHGPGLSDGNLRKQALDFSRLGGEVFMLDDQWQGKSAGDWQWDPTRFPLGSDGVPRFVHYLHALGLRLGLWMSPAEFNPGSATYRSHPQWACTPTGDASAQLSDDSGLGVWDMTNRRFQNYLTGVISRLISQDGVREFKFDYVTWVDCPPHDYVDYEDAYTHWVQHQERLHPGVTFELDETNDQRLWPFRSAALGPSWFDNGHLRGSSYPARLLHDLWSAAPWIPPSSLGFGLYDGDLVGPYTADYLMPMALLGHVTFWSDLTKLSSDQVARTAWWLRWYAAHRTGLDGLVYDDTPSDPIDGSAWAAFQPWAGKRGGFLFAFRQGGSADTEAIELQGLRPGASYVLTDVRSGAVLGTYSGARLEHGLPVTLDRPYSAIVVAITPAN